MRELDTKSICTTNPASSTRRSTDMSNSSPKPASSTRFSTDIPSISSSQSEYRFEISSKYCSIFIFYTLCIHQINSFNHFAAK